VAVSFAGVLWTPGHTVYGDRNGVVVTERALSA
jgi:regulator of RNase E activity RraA